MNTIVRILTLAALLAAVPLLAAPAAASEPIPAYAQHRLDRVAAALGRDPLFVDPDMAAALDEAGRARVRGAMRSAADALGAPVYVVVIPNKAESETQGRDDAFLHAIHDRLRRDGLYILVGTSAWFEEEAFGVPRRLYAIDDDRAQSPANPDNKFADLADRLAVRLRIIQAAPSSTPRTPRLYTSPDPFGQEHTVRTVEPETKPPFLTGLLLVGPVAALVLYGAGAGAAAYRRHRRTPRAPAVESYANAPAEPSVKWLRRTGLKELDRLRDALATAEDDDPGREYAVSAYDVAQILHDDAAEDPDRALDLAGAIVLARQGRAALTRRMAAAPPPCFVNPLHGPSAQRRKVQLGGGATRRRPVCTACGAKNPSALRDRTLKVPGPNGPRPHHTVPGVWKDTGFGADGNLIPRIQEYLGVE
ncbi:hypothetical protein SAMN05443665_10089 [Actinomadura meyerae]|uniref:DUF4350 domain-containing protein n=1 Tax=Actinomadura meyerae TaxID=240840 RepID=A0A239GKU6_9ACTN|nr:hypothetical protein [Actinomadura meyerae]SNS69789.1 hypothetical protein SAMN05443665_10089 [Actinomadura meyerae]